MTSEKLIEVLETYSNVIVGFMVVQSIGFSFTFATTPTFTCTVHTARYLAPGLIAHFIGSTILACIAIALMAKVIRRHSGEHADVVRYIYWAKAFVVVLFTLIPIVLVYVYSVDEVRTYAQCMSDRKGL